MNIATLQHNRFRNVFGLGDVCNLPTAKSAAAVCAQTPIVVNNLLVEMGYRSTQLKYEGYSATPLYVGDGKLMMIEFKYGGVGDESFLADQTKPRKAFHIMNSEVFPRAYFTLLPRGKFNCRSYSVTHGQTNNI